MGIGRIFTRILWINLILTLVVFGAEAINYVYFESPSDYYSRLSGTEVFLGLLASKLYVVLVLGLVNFIVLFVRSLFRRYSLLLAGLVVGIAIELASYMVSPSVRFVLFGTTVPGMLAVQTLLFVILYYMFIDRSTANLPAAGE